MSAPVIKRRPADGVSPSTFDLFIDGTNRGYLEFSLPDAATVVIHYVEIDPALRGRGLGERLVGAAVEWARAESRRVVPRCSYARAVIARTPAYQDVEKR
jgi:predicted GNAT family acetyltransferase